MLGRSEHVTAHKVVVAAKLVEIQGGGSDHPDVLVGEAAAQRDGHLLQTPAEPLGGIRLQSHLILEVLHEERAHQERLTSPHQNKDGVRSFINGQQNSYSSFTFH